VLKQGLSNMSSSQPAPRRDVARPRMPRRLGVRDVSPTRGCVPTEDAPLPKVPAPCDALKPARHAPPRRRAVHAADRRSLRGPARTHAGRGAPYHNGIFAADVMATRAGLFKHRPLLPRAMPSRPCRAACHGSRQRRALASRRS
jgi:hypothetical protein